MSNPQIKRILLACVIAILVFTAIFLLLPKTDLVITAFCFALFAPILVCGTLCQISLGSKDDMVTNAVFPFQSFLYISLNLLLNVCVVALELTEVTSMPITWFCTLHIILLAFCAWRFLALSAAQHTIRQTEQNVKKNTKSWMNIIALTDELLTNAPAALKRPLEQLRDSVRFADPVTRPELGETEQDITDRIKELAKDVNEVKEDDFKERVDGLIRSIKNRNNALKQFK